MHSQEADNVFDFSSPGQRAYRSNVPPISATIAGERSTSPIESALSVRNTHPAPAESPWQAPLEVIHRFLGDNI